MSDAGRVALALLLAAGLAGCGSPEPYQTKDGGPARVDGTEPSVDSITIGEASRGSVPRLAYVEGYLMLPYDDVGRLCTRISAGGACVRPSLVLDNPSDDLRRLGAPVLEHGCCSVGAWSPDPVVLHVWLRPGRRAHVLG